MAIIPKYSRQVSPQALPDVKYTQTGGGESAAAFNGVSALATGLDQYQEKQDTDTVVQALNSAKLDAMEFYNGENGLFAQKGNNATGTMDKAKKFNDDTITKYTSFMQNDRQKNAFLKHYSQTAGVFLSDAMTHERSESAKAFQQNIANTREIAKQRGVANYNSMPTLDDAINDITTSVGLEGSRNGYSADVVKSNKDKEVTDTVRQAFNQAMDLQDYTSAGKIVEAYKDKVNPSVFGKMKAAYQKVQDKIFEFKTADDIIKQSMLPDGTVDRAKANQLIDASFGVSSKKTISGSVTWEQAKALVSGNESNGDYSAFNADSGATGKYQFTDDTWQRIMGDAEKTPENQEKAFEHYRPIFNKYGIEGVLVAVYAGDGNAERYAKGLPLVGDNGNEYSADAPQYTNGREYPSVNQYVQNAISNIQDETKSAVDPVKHEAVSRMVDARILDINRAKTEEDKRYRESLAEQINSADTLNIANALIDSAKLTLAQKKTLYNSVKTKFKALAGKPTSEQLFFSKYEKSGLYADLKKMQEYEFKSANSEEIEEKEQTKYNTASERLQAYWAFSSGGAYGAKPEQANNDITPSSLIQESNSRWYSQQFEEIKSKNPGVPDEEIYQFLTEKIKQAGG